MKKIYFILVLAFLFIPYISVNALETSEELELISQTDKYYKTTTYNNYMCIPNSITEEITKNEYDNFDVSMIKGDATVETTYKKLTSQIYQNGNKYRYKAVLTWKNMPSTRSYDIMAIGHHASVQRDNGPYFSLYFCKSDGTCTTTTSHYPQTFSAGSGVSFKLPNGSLTTLISTLYFDVVKTNANSTIYSQIAAADYAHATSSVTSSQSMNYTVGTNGISLGSGITSKYDSMNAAIATWNGTW